MKTPKKIKIKSKIPRADVEWTILFKPYENILLDRIIFRGNLTKANDGKGWKFHIRSLAKETNMSTGKTSELVKSWNFITKIGQGEKSYFVFSMNKFRVFLQTRIDTYYSKIEASEAKQPVQVVNIGVQDMSKGVQDVSNKCSSGESECSENEPRKSNEKEEKKEEIEQIGNNKNSTVLFENKIRNTSDLYSSSLTFEQISKLTVEDRENYFDYIFKDLII